MKNRKKGSFTIEAAMIVPILLLIVATVITILFYWHDRNVLAGIVYETAVVGAERTERDETELTQYAEKLIRGKLLWFPDAEVRVEKTKEQVTVTATAKYRGMKTVAKTVMSDTHPETYIRTKEKIDENILQK